VLLLALVGKISIRSDVILFSEGTYGQLGTGSTMDSDTPSPVTGLKDIRVVQIVAGMTFSACLTGTSPFSTLDLITEADVTPS
jgi:hypothetical protein